MTAALLVTDTVTFRGERPSSTPADAFRGGLPGLLDRVVRVLSGVGVVLLDRWSAGQLGLPVDELPIGGAGRQHPAALAARAAGWEVDEIHRWSVFSRPGGTRVAVGLLDLVDPEYCPLVAYAPVDTAARFDAWHRLSGMPWWGDAGDAVCHLIQHTAAVRGRGRPVTPVWRTWAESRDGWIERAYSKGQFDRVDDVDADWLQGLDAVRAYLAAMGVTEVAAGPLVSSGRIRFDKARAGWWMVDSAPWTVPDMPDPRGYHPDGWDGPRPLTTPTLALLSELAELGVYGGFTVLDSWTGPGTRGVLRPAAERLQQMWDAAAGLVDPGDAAAVRAAVQAGYQAAHGKWRSKQSPIRRPDWAAALVAKARTNLWRKAWKAYQAGYAPAAVTGIDTVWYPAPAGDQTPPPPGFDLATGPNRWGQLGQYRRKHLIATPRRETNDA